MADLDWLELGFEGRGLAHLVMQCGRFYEAHRAENDVLALVYLRAHQLADRETILKKLIACAEQSTEGARLALGRGNAILVVRGGSHRN